MKQTLISSPLSLGQALRLARSENTLSQKEVGARVGVDQATISSVENGNPGTRVETIFHLLAALDLELTVQPRVRTPKSKESW